MNYVECCKNHRINWKCNGEEKVTHTEKREDFGRFIFFSFRYAKNRARVSEREREKESEWSGGNFFLLE